MTITSWRIVLASVLLLSSCAATPPAHAPVEKLDWRPNIDQPIRQLEEVLAETQQQQPMNYTSSNLAFLLDTKLYLLFERYTESLPPNLRAEAVAEQRRWLDERSRTTNEAYDEYAGGTLASYSGNMAVIHATKKRLAEIEKRLR